MSADDSHLLFETYKLHAELAEQAASLREGLNKMYSGMVTSIVAASVLLHRLAPNAEAVWVLPTLGILVSLSWMLALHSVTGRLSAKHTVLVALETRLPFNFLDRQDHQHWNVHALRLEHFVAAPLPRGIRVGVDGHHSTILNGVVQYRHK